MSSNAVHMLHNFVIILYIYFYFLFLKHHKHHTNIQHTFLQSVYLITFITLQLTPRRTLTGEYLENLFTIMGQKKYMLVEHESNILNFYFAHLLLEGFHIF